MTQLSAYDLKQKLNTSFKVTFESEQDIEIQAEEVVINSPVSVDEDIEELNEDVSAVTKTATVLDDVDVAEVTLESLITSMESSVLTGGFDKRSATLANITLESISTKFGLPTTTLSFGMEAVGEDGEAETKSTIGKAKQMISGLKANTGALLNKMYISAASALNNTTALSTKLLAKATALKSNVNTDNNGGNPVKLSRGVKRKLTLDGNTVLSPDEYVKELKRLVSKYNNVVKVYSDSDVLGTFVNDVAISISKPENEPKSKRNIIAVTRSISEGITKPVKSADGIELAESAPYLGGAKITLKRPTKKTVEDALFAPAKNNQVSQEGIGRATLGIGQTVFGAVLFTGGIGLCFANGSALAVNIGKVVTGNVAGGLVGIAGNIVAMYILDYGLNKGMANIQGGALKTKEETDKLINYSRSKLAKNVDEAVALTTEFSVDTNGASMENNEEVTVNSLSAKQIAEVATIIQQTSGTTQAMKSELNKRKAALKTIDTITKEMASQAEGETTVLSTSAHAFIKQFIKQTIKFEMDLTAYSVGVMKAALAYAESSNGATAPAAPAEPEVAAE